MEAYWRACGLKVTEVMEGGWLVKRPDFKVVQISLLAYKGNASKLEKLKKWIESTRITGSYYAVEPRKANPMVNELNRLLRTADPVQKKMFFNVWSGPGKASSGEDNADPARVMMELAELGIRSDMALGPLLMKTAGKIKGSPCGGWVDMDSIFIPAPILSKSTYTFLNKVVEKAYKGLMSGEGDPDMVFGKGRDAPKISHHSWRRLADTKAKEKLARKECEKDDIELHFGWKLAEHKKDMTKHYDRGQRTSRARITEDI